MWDWLWGPAKQYSRRERLATTENTVMFHNYHISTLSYLARKPAAQQTAGAEDTEAWMRRRCAEVVRKNPYLTGDFVRQGNDIILAWNDVPSDESVAQCLQVVRGDATLNALLGQVRRRQEGTEQGSADGLFVAITHRFCDHHALKPDQCRWRVYLVDLSDAGDGSADYALVTALVHSVGDGHTYYKLHNMHSADVQPYALEPKRDYSLDLQENHKYLPAGLPIGDDNFYTCIIPSAIYVGLRYLAYAAVGRTAPPPFGRTFAVDRAAVEAEKRRVCAEPGNTEAFVSTNDVLASFFLNKLPTDMCYNQYMALSTRARIPEHKDNMVGNYVDAVVFSKKDTISPTLIRRVLKNGGPAALADDGPRPLWKRFGGVFGVVTNWAGFHTSITTPAHEEAFHFPVVKVIGAGTLAWIHQWTKDELAVTFSVDARTPGVTFASGGLFGRQLL